MRKHRSVPRPPALILALALSVALPLVPAAAMLPSGAEAAVGPTLSGTAPPLPVRPELATQLDEAAAGETLLVLVTGVTTARAEGAVAAAGLVPVEVFDRLSVVAAAGSADAIRALHAQPGVRRVDPNLELRWQDEVAHRATGVAQLRDSQEHPQLRRERRPDGLPFDGTGVSIAVVDSGFDATHESFVEDGETKFDVHLRQACPLFNVAFVLGLPEPECSVWVPAVSSADDQYAHGTLVASVAAGYPRALASGAASGVAPGARLVGLSIGIPVIVPINIYNVLSAWRWVLEHHDDPCGDGSCPPIRVMNNSWSVPADNGLTADSFDPDAPWNRAISQLVDEGVVVVFAAGNDGGDGSTPRTNLFALHPRVLSVGGFHHGDAGDRNGTVAWFSSRGKKGDPSTYPDLVAPAVRVLAACAGVTCDPDGLPDGSADFPGNGTSFAAPYVAGVVAQLLEADPSLGPDEVKDILQDSAYQGFIDDDLLEPDRFTDPTGVVRGNHDHPTSYHAGHGLVDAVGALGLAIRGTGRAAPPYCPGRGAERTVGDPVDDLRVLRYLPSPVPRPHLDLIEVTSSLQREPGSLTVEVMLGDVPEADARMHLRVTGQIDGDYFEAALDRSLDGDAFSVISGEVQVEGSVDPGGGTVTFAIRPEGGTVLQRGGVALVWTADAPFPMGPGTHWLLAPADTAGGICSVWAR